MFRKITEEREESKAIDKKKANRYEVIVEGEIEFCGDEERIKF